MLKTVYSALAVTALLAGTASFAADQTSAPATQATPVATAAQSAPAKAEGKATIVKADHVVKTGKTKDAATPTTDASAPTAKK